MQQQKKQAATKDSVTNLQRTARYWATGQDRFTQCLDKHTESPMDIKVFQTGILSVNTYVVPLCDNYVFVVDPAGCSLSGDSYTVVEYLRKNNLICVAVVLTHGHFDHISGISHIIEAFPRARIAIHAKDAQELLNPPGDMNLFTLQNFGIPDMAEVLQNQPAPTDLLSGTETLGVLAQDTQPIGLKDALSQWQVLPTPGHSPGSICLYNETEKVLISGDTLFADGYGRTDLPGGNENLIGRSLALLEQDIPTGTYLCPGHGRRIVK